MKTAFVVFVAIHALIHILGFVKSIRPSAVRSIKQPLSFSWGIVWLIALLFFLALIVLFLLKNSFWWIPAFIALLISQWVIIHSWRDAKFGTIANVLILAVSLVGFGTWNFYLKYENEVNKALQQTVSDKNSVLSEADIQHLPKPVQKYIRYTGSIGKPKVRHFKIEFKGKIRKDEKSEWMPFTSEQFNFMEKPTRMFFMKAMMKKMPVAGFHSYTNGEAFMDIRLFSLYKVQYQEGKEMDIAETVTFFNDMCCMAPSTLTDPGIKWAEADSTKVRAEFTTNGITISAWLYFNEKDELVNFVSDDRYAAGEDGIMKKVRWSTPLQDYKDINGYKLAGSAETIYSYPDGDFCYGIFSLLDIDYNN